MNFSPWLPIRLSAGSACSIRIDLAMTLARCQIELSASGQSRRFDAPPVTSGLTHQWTSPDRPDWSRFVPILLQESGVTNENFQRRWRDLHVAT
jgi:hypothetical protein